MREYVIARVFTPKPRSLGCGVSFCAMVSCFRIRLAVCQALERSRLKPLLLDSGIWQPEFPRAARDRGQSPVGAPQPTMHTLGGRGEHSQPLTTTGSWWSEHGSTSCRKYVGERE